MYSLGDQSTRNFLMLHHSVNTDLKSCLSKWQYRSSFPKLLEQQPSPFLVGGIKSLNNVNTLTEGILSSQQNHFRHRPSLGAVPGYMVCQRCLLTSCSSMTRDGVEAKMVFRHPCVKILFCQLKAVFSI